MTAIGFVGLGTMGGPMCANLVRAGHRVVVFDLDPQAVERAVAVGAQAAAGAAELAGRVELFLTSLPHPHHVEAVMVEAGALTALRSGSIWVDLTTNRADLVRSLAERAPAGVDVVDAPVTGAVDGARRGALTLFMGGRPAATDRVRPVLAHLGTVIDCGDLGAGNVVKLVTNQLWFIHAAAIGEGFALGLANGVALDVLWDAIRHSVSDSFVAHHDAPSIFAGHYDPSFPLDLCVKDLDLLAELEDGVGAELPMTGAAREVFTDAARRYGLGAGELHVARRLEDDTGLSFRLDGDWTPHWEA